MKSDSYRNPVPPGLFLNAPKENITKRIRMVDIIGIDVDNCLMRGHGQIHIAVKLLPEILLLAFKGFPLEFSRKILAGISGLFVFQLKKSLGTDSFNLFIMECFARTLQGIDREHFEAAIGAFKRYVRPGAAKALRSFLNMAPVVLLSLGLEPVVKWLLSQCLVDTERSSVRVYANRIKFDTVCGRKVFAGYDRTWMVRNGKEKLELMVREASRIGARSPLVIGHDENDVELVKWASERGGVSLGFMPRKDCRHLFDVVIDEPSWDRVVDFFRCLRVDEG